MTQKIAGVVAKGALFLTLLVGGCGSSSNREPPVELVVGGMLIEGSGAQSEGWTYAVRLAVDDMDKALASVSASEQGAWRKPVTFRLEARNVVSNEQMAHDVMNEYQTLSTKIVLTEGSASSIGANKWNYEDAHLGVEIPLVSYLSTSASLNNATATDPDPVGALALRDPRDWFFRTCQRSDLLAPVRIDYIFHRDAADDGRGVGDVNGDGVVKIVWIGTTDTSTQSSIAADQSAFDTYVAGLANRPRLIMKNVSFDVSLTPETFDFNPYIMAALDSSDDGFAPDLLVNKTQPTVAVPFIKSYKQNPANTTAIFEDGSFRRNTLLAALGAAADGHLGVSTIAYENSTTGTLFATEEKAVTGWPPAANEAQGYDAMIMALLAVLKASQQVDDPTATTPAMVRENLKTLSVPTSQDPNRLLVTGGATALADAIRVIISNPTTNINYDGASGPVDFDAVGNVTSRAVVWGVQDGQFKERKYYDCTAGPCNATTWEAALPPR